SVDLLTARALGPKPMGKSGGGSIFSSKLIWWRVPSGAKESQGSLARSNAPPEQSVRPGTTLSSQVVPPSKLTPATLLLAPPFDQRSCCQSATIKINQTPANAENPRRQQAFIPSVAVAQDGTVVVTYYDFRHDTPRGELTDHWLIRCPTACADLAH